MRYSGSWPATTTRCCPVSGFPSAEGKCVFVCVCLGGRASGCLKREKACKRGRRRHQRHGKSDPLFPQSRPYGSETKEMRSAMWPWTPWIPPPVWLHSAFHSFNFISATASTRDKLKLSFLVLVRSTFFFLSFYSCCGWINYTVVLSYWRFFLHFEDKRVLICEYYSVFGLQLWFILFHSLTYSSIQVAHFRSQSDSLSSTLSLSSSGWASFEIWCTQ